MQDKLKLFELPKDKFLDEIINNWKKHKPLLTKDFVSYMVKESLTIKSEATLLKMTKEQLKDLILNGDKEAEPTQKSVNSSSNFGEEVAQFLSDIKEVIQEDKLNPMLKKWLVKSINKLMIKFEGNDNLENVGFVGNIVVLILTLVDVFIKGGIKELPKRIKEFREKRAEKKINDSKE